MKYLFLIIALSSCQFMFAQVQGVTQSAEGKSTIPIRGTAVGIDIAKAELSFGYNNINQVVETKKVKPIYGAAVKVKNEEGIGNLFSSGDKVADGNLTAFAGVTFSNTFASSEMANIRKRQALTKAYDAWEKKFRNEASAEFLDYFTNLSKSISDGAEKAKFNANLKKHLLNVKGSEETFYDDIKNESSATASIDLLYKAMIEYSKKKQDEFAKVRSGHIKKLKELFNNFSDISFQRFTIFGFGGISAIGFKKFDAVDSSNLSNSFKNIDERGGTFGIGINYQWRNIWLGITYSYESTSNFATLDKKDYTLRRTINLAPESFVDEVKTTAYSGKYGEVEVNNLNADLIFRFNLDKEYKNFLLVNPYLRATVASRDTSLLPNKTNLGVGLYFFPNNAKTFSGGIYLELPDVNNSIEKKKPISEQNLRSPFRRLSFGVIAKFSLSSIVGW